MKRNTKYVALDVHQATTVASVREESGRVIARTILPTEVAFPYNAPTFEPKTIGHRWHAISALWSRPRYPTGCRTPHRKKRTCRPPAESRGSIVRSPPQHRSSRVHYGSSRFYRKPALVRYHGSVSNFAIALVHGLSVARCCRSGLLTLLLVLCGPAAASAQGRRAAESDYPAVPHQLDRAVAVAFKRVLVVPMTGQDILHDHTVIVREGRVVALGRADEVTVPSGTAAIDGGGRYLMPGLADMHVHLLHAVAR